MMNQNTFLPPNSAGLYDAHIIISDNRTKHILPISDIMRLESKRVYTIIYVKNKQQYVCSRNLKVVYEELHSQIFFRIHKSHVINLQEVKAYREGRGGQVIMSDNTIIDVAQRKKMEFLKYFQQLSTIVV